MKLQQSSEQRLKRVDQTISEIERLEMAEKVAEAAAASMWSRWREAMQVAALRLEQSLRERNISINFDTFNERVAVKGGKVSLVEEIIIELSSPIIAKGKIVISSRNGEMYHQISNDNKEGEYIRLEVEPTPEQGESLIFDTLDWCLEQMKKRS